MQKFAKVKIIFKTPCEILGGYEDMKPGVLCEI